MVTANGEAKTNEEAHIYVHELEIFVTVQILDDTRADLSLGKLCEEHGYTHEWTSGQKPHLTKDRKKILRKTANFVPVVVPGLSSNSGASSSSTSLPQDSSSSSSPASFRSDEGVSGHWRNPPRIQKKEQQGGSRRPLRYLSEWVEEFTENLEDTVVPASANISHVSDS